jgi:hypothetical protein
MVLHQTLRAEYLSTGRCRTYIQLLITPFRQVTWEIMAADFVKRSDIPQTLVHDLESFFWVLLWLVLTKVETNWKGGRLSSFIMRPWTRKFILVPDEVPRVR